MKYKMVRDENKIDKILDIVLNDIDSKKLYRISRIDCFNINFYFQLSDFETIYFKVYNPTQYGIDTIKERELIT